MLPDDWRIAEVYERLAEDSCANDEILKGIWEIYHSWMDARISDHNAVCYEEGVIL